MKFHLTNGWFDGSEFMRAAAEVHKQATTNHIHWMPGFAASGSPAIPADCKYVQLYVDQRTGDFIFRSAGGAMLSHEDVYALFPALRG